MMRHSFDTAEASALATTSALTFFEPATSLTLAAVSGLSSRLVTAFRKGNQKPKQNVIVQAFYDLERVEGAESAANLRHSTLTWSEASADVAESPDALESAIQNVRAIGSNTEKIHDYLLALPFGLAGRVVAGLTQSDLERIVNKRRFQESYIIEYLGDLWHIEQKAFWSHIATMFKSPEGLIIGETDDHLERMMVEDMPPDVWHLLLESMLRSLRSRDFGKVDEFLAELLAGVVVAQTTVTKGCEQRKREFDAWVAGLPANDRDRLRPFLDRAVAESAGE